MENILKGKVNDNKMIEKIKIINEYEDNLNNLKENENINKLKNYIKKLKNSIYGKDKGKIKTEQARSFEDQKGKGYVDLPILLSKLNINSSKELVSNVKQVVKNLYDNKQITKQVYNILNKSITYLRKNLKIMTRKDQIKILDDKIKVNNMQYDLDRMNAEISAYSSGDLPKYEYLTKKDLGYKPDAVEKVKFEYSPIGKVFTDGLAKEDKSKKVGLFKGLKNIEDNLAEVDDNDNKVGIF